MAFWSSETLKTRVEQQKLIDPYDPEAIKHAAYELTLGGEAFVTSFKEGVKQVFKEGDQLCIPPGQFGLLLTREVVEVPTNSIAFISIRASVKFRGLVNISGFHVDPGYKGQLQFSVYNAGSQTLILDPGQRIFMIWYADLDQETQDGYNGSRGRRNGISAQDVENIQGDIASPGALKIAFDDLEKDYLQRMSSIDNNLLIIKTLFGAIVVGIAMLLISQSFSRTAPSPTNSPQVNIIQGAPSPAPNPTSTK